MLSNLLPVFTYKDTTLKAVCQVLHASFIHLMTNQMVESASGVLSAAVSEADN